VFFCGNFQDLLIYLGLWFSEVFSCFGMDSFGQFAQLLEYVGL
jgi:hypothetical protein